MSMFLVFDIVFVVLGIWMIWSAQKMKKTGTISDWILAEEDLRKCKKQAEFISYLSPWMIGIGVGVCVIGASGALYELEVLPVPYWRYVVMMAVLVLIGVFWTRLSHARIEYVL